MNFKRSKKIFVSLAMLFALSATTAHAEGIPLMVPYAGSVAVDGEGFDGSGLFKFAIVNKSCTIEAEIAQCLTLWSNDGTSATGLEPTDAVQIPVSNGNFSVKLGDTALTNMTEMATSVFDNEATFLRVWFNDGASGFQQLSSDRQLVSIPYAYKANKANTVEAGAIGGDQINKAEVQSRVQACDDGLTIHKINEDGTVECIASNTYTAGSGLTIDASNEFSIDPDTITKIDNAAAKAIAASGGLTSNTVNGTQTISIDSTTIATINNAASAAALAALDATTVKTTDQITSSQILNDTILSTDINDGTIVNADISASAAISASKISGKVSDANLLDGINSSQFARTDTNESFDNGTLYIDAASNEVGIGDTTPSQKLDVAGNVAANNFMYRSARTYYHFITGSSFTMNTSDRTDSELSNFTNAGYIHPAGTGTNALYFNSNLHLPDGASIANMRCYYYDNNATLNWGDMDYYIKSRAYTSTSVNNIVAQSTFVPAVTASTSIRSSVTNDTPSTLGNPINNAVYGYNIWVRMVPTGASSNLRFYGCRVQYSLTTLSH